MDEATGRALRTITEMLRNVDRELTNRINELDWDLTERIKELEHAVSSLENRVVEFERLAR